MRRCNIITDKEGKEMFVKDAELVVFKLLPPLEYIIQKGYHTAGYPTVNNIMQDYNEAVNYDENASQNSMGRSYYQSCIRDTNRYIRYYVEKEGVTTGDVYVGSNNIEGNNLSIGYDEGYTHHRTYTNNGKLDNVIYKLRDEEGTVEDALKKHRKKNEEAKGYEMKEIDADFVRQHLDPKLYIDEEKNMRYGEPLVQEQSTSPEQSASPEQQKAGENIVNAILNNGQVVVTSNDDGTVTVPAGTETGDVHIEFEDDDDGMVESIVGDFNDEPEEDESNN